MSTPSGSAHRHAPNCDRLYLDHAATTPLRRECATLLAELAPLALNPSSVHSTGQHARRLLEEARTELAQAIQTDPHNIVFTSGATESANLALRGMASSFASRGKAMVVASAPIEHACVRETIGALTREGRVLHRAMPVDGRGCAEPAAADGADVLSLMAVQNETGVVQDLASARAFGTTGRWWFCDASQALGKISINVTELGAWLVAFSSHKIGGPAGVGALVGEGIRHIIPQMTGGPQEHEVRAGTTPVALAISFARAARIAVEQLEARSAHCAAFEDALLPALAERRIEFRRNGDAPHAPGFVNLSIPRLDGSDLVIALDTMGIDVSSGAACSTGVMEVSPAIAAMYPADRARAAGALRITFGIDTPVGGAIRLADAIAEVHNRLMARRAP